ARETSAIGLTPHPGLIHRKTEGLNGPEVLRIYAPSADEKLAACRFAQARAACPFGELCQCDPAALAFIIEGTLQDRVSNRWSCRVARAGTRLVAMLSWPRVAWTSGSEAPRSMACEPWACLSQCGETAALMPALAAARLTIALTL